MFKIPSPFHVLLFLFLALGQLAGCKNHPPNPTNTSSDIIRPVAKPATATPVTPSHPVDSAATSQGEPNTFFVDLNDDGIPDTIFLSRPRLQYHIFTAITLSIRGHAKQTFTVADTSQPWTDFDENFTEADSNAVQTRQFLLRKAKSHALLVLSGYLYETGPRQGLTIIKLVHGNAKLVFDQIPQHFDLESVDLRDLDHDGRFELLAGHMFEFGANSDTLDGKIGPYNPMYVYTIDDSFFLNKPLMKKYNEEHSVFAGYERTDRIKVWYPNSRGRPRLWK